MVVDVLRILIVDGDTVATARLSALLQRLSVVGMGAWSPVLLTGPDEVPPAPLDPGRREVLVLTGCQPDPAALARLLDRAGDRPVLWACPRHDLDGSLAAVRGGAQDVLVLEGLCPESLRGTLERALVRAARLAQERRARLAAETRAQTRADLLTHLAHEFRTPLSGLIGLTDLLREESLTVTQAERVSQIQRGAHELMDLVANVLERSRSEAGRQVLEPTDFHLPELIDEVLCLVRPLARAKGLGLVSQVAAGLAPERHGDRRRLRQVLLNLVGNAIKFTDRGGVTLELHADPCDPEGLILGVHDSGLGIDLDRQLLLFQPFTRVPGDPSQREGTGLGLAISRELVELMGGRLDLESQPGLGSTFWIRLPLPLAAPAAVSARSRPSDAGGRPPALPLPQGAPALPLGREARPAPGTERPRVLVAEDHAINRQLLRLWLERAGASVREVGTGTEAVQAFQAEPFDLVILDLHLPGLNGFETALALRRHEEGGTDQPLLSDPVPLVAATAHTSDEIHIACITYGFDGMLSKPVTAATLAPWIQKAQERLVNGQLGLRTRASMPGDVVCHPARAVSGYQSQQLVELYGGDPLLASELALAFLLEAPPLFNDLSEAFRIGDLAELATVAHGLKGMSLTIAAFQLADLIEGLQQAARRAEAASALSWLEAVQRYWSTLRQELEPLAARSPMPPRPPAAAPPLAVDQ